MRLKQGCDGSDYRREILRQSGLAEEEEGVYDIYVKDVETADPLRDEELVAALGYTRSLVIRYARPQSVPVHSLSRRSIRSRSSKMSTRSSIHERPSSDMISSQMDVFFPRLGKSTRPHSLRRVVWPERGLLSPIVGSPLADPALEPSQEMSLLSLDTTTPIVSQDAFYQHDDWDSPEKLTDISWIRSYLIGKGSFGKVYLGMDTKTGAFLAIKQVDTHLPSTNAPSRSKNVDKMIKALHVEIELMKELKHENIVQYLGFDYKEGVMSLLMEYVSGGSVASLISKFGSLPVKVCVNITVQVLKGLEYLHCHSIIHRDVKGANSM